MNIQSLSLKQLAKTVLARVWLAFSVVLGLGVIWSGLLNPTSLLSDDPYLLGFAFASVAAGLAFIYSTSDCFKLLAQWKHRITATALIGWCVALVVWEYFTEHEWDGLGYVWAIGSLVSGVAGWTVCACRLPFWIRSSGSAMGVAILIAYGFVILRMYTRA